MALERKRTKRPRHTPRSPKKQSLDTEQVLTRLDEMIRELQLMRRLLATPTGPSQPPGLTAQLFGALGHGTWEEFDMDLPWKRFAE